MSTSTTPISGAESHPDAGDLGPLRHGAIRALLQRGSIYTFSAASQLLISALLLPVLTRVMSAAEYGIVALAILIGGLTGAIGAAGLPAAISRAYFAERAGQEVARRLVIGSVLPAVAVVFFAEITSPAWIAALGSVHEPLALRLGVLATVPTASVAACGAYLRCMDRAGAFVTVTLVSSVGGTLLGIAGVAVDRAQGATSYTLGMLIGMTLAAVVGMKLISRQALHPPRWPELRAALRVGAPLIPQGIAWLVLALGDRAVIQALSGSRAVGRYQVAYTVGAVGLSLVTALYSALPPIIYGGREAGRWDNLDAVLNTTKLLAAPIAATLAVVGPVVLRLFVDSSYSPSGLAGVIAPVAASMLPWAIYGMRCNVLVWNKRTGVIAWSTIVSAVLNVALVWLLLPPFGLAGAASATLVAYWLLAGFMWKTTRREARASWDPIVVFAWLVGSALIVAGAVVPVHGIWVPIRLCVGAGSIVTAIVAIVKLVRGELLSGPPASLDPGRQAMVA